MVYHDLVNKAYEYFMAHSSAECEKRVPFCSETTGTSCSLAGLRSARGDLASGPVSGPGKGCFFSKVFVTIWNFVEKQRPPVQLREQASWKVLPTLTLGGRPNVYCKPAAGDTRRLESVSVLVLRAAAGSRDACCSAALQLERVELLMSRASDLRVLRVQTISPGPRERG